MSGSQPKKYAYIISRQNGNLELIYQDSYKFTLETIHKELDGFFEVVTPALLQNTLWQNVRFLCDDNGLYKEHLRPNALASALYAGYSAIVGDIIICSAIPAEIDPEPDIYPFSESDGKLLYDYLSRLNDKIKEIPYPWD